uniref:Secreted protein n=1 Tax=Cacopsylla melanoneura TaxID=428564 RepID=A0A8D9AWT9_9HEMI
MSRYHISLLLLSTLLVLASAVDETDTQPAKLKERAAVRFGDASQPRTARLFGNLLDLLLDPPRFNYYDYDGGYCPPNRCPDWRCQDDSAVIHGWCCGCARPSDNVPFVTCRPDLRCPISAEPLCTDYNFMMDCCCTGP